MGVFRRTDSPYWWYRVQLKHKVVTGSTNTADRRLALRIYMEKHHQFTEEHHLPSLRGQSTKFVWMCGEYMDKHAKVNKRSWKDDEVIVNKLKRHFGDVPLLSIQPQAIEGYKAARKGFVTEATINRELAVLKTIFAKAVQWGYAHRNPVKEIRLFKEERTPIKMLTPEERQRLFDAAPEFLRPILLIALKTGMRQGEILQLKWKEVDLAHETISVTHTKAKKLRQVPIHPELGAMFRELPRRSEFVFTNEDGLPYSQNGKVRKAFDRLKDALGLDLTFHAAPQLRVGADREGRGHPDRSRVHGPQLASDATALRSREPRDLALHDPTPWAGHEDWQDGRGRRGRVRGPRGAISRRSL